MDFVETRNITKKLIRESNPSIEKYEQALPYCKKLYEAFSETSNLWDVHQYANCLKKLGNINAAELVCDSIYKQLVNNELTNEEEKPFRYIKKLYAWIIYEKYIKVLRTSNNVPDESLLINKTMLLCNLICQNEQAVPSLSFCIFQVAKYIIKNSGLVCNEKILLLFDNLDIERLSHEARKINDESGKERELASELEEFYRYKSEVLLRCKHFEECISCCNEAIEKIPQLHYNNEVWFERRVAQAFDGLGDIDKKIEKLDKLTVISDKWFLLSEIGNCYFRKKEHDKALYYMLRAVCTKDPDKMKVGLIESIGDVCNILGDKDFAQQNFLLAKTIRVENGWFIKDSLKRKIKEEQQFSYKEIRKNWIKKLYFIAGENKGKVIKLFPRNSGGFIQSDKQTYYFQSKNFFGEADLIKLGDQVCYIIIDSYDKKKQKSTKEASIITPFKSYAH